MGLQFFKSLGLTKSAHLAVVFFRGPYGVHPVLKMLVVVVFFNGGGGVGILQSLFFQGGHSVIVKFALSSPSI